MKHCKWQSFSLFTEIHVAYQAESVVIFGVCLQLLNAQEELTKRDTDAQEKVEEIKHLQDKIEQLQAQLGNMAEERYMNHTSLQSTTLFGISKKFETK